MNALILIFFLSLSGSQAACLPDSLVSKGMSSPKFLNLRDIESAVAVFESSITSDLPTDHDLIINLESHNPRVNAEITKLETAITLTVWGGMIGHDLLSQEAFLLLLCHEIGHVLGGQPLKSRTGWSSTEGQADYFSATCAKKLGLGETEFMEAALNLSRIYAQVTLQPEPSLSRCDSSAVTRTNFGYPQVQCRLDTMLAGWRGEPRPRCWFLP